MPTNQEQIDFWNGPAGARWVKHNAALDQALSPFGAAVMRRLRLTGGEHVMDLGCGCGTTSRQLAARVGPGGRVRAVDVSRPMLQYARQQPQNQPWLEFIEADASSHDFGAAFDAIYSRFGVMFFADPTAAFASLGRRLVTRGQLAFVCWRSFADNPWATLPLQAARAAVPDAVEPFEAKGPGPYAFADPDDVTRILGDAGFLAIRLEQFDAGVVFSTTGLEAAIDFASTAGPLARVLGNASEAVRAEVRAALATALEPFRSGQTIALQGSSWIVTASASSPTQG